MSRNISDLNELLFRQLDRLDNIDATGDQLQEEIERTKAISGVAKDIANNAKLQMQHHHMLIEYGKAPSQAPEILGIGNDRKKT